MLEFWATWCGPCVEAIPHINQLAEQFKAEPIDLVTVTDEEEPLVRRFLGAHPMKGLIGIDKGGRTWQAFDLTFLPTTVLIDAKGRLAAITSPSHVDAGVLKKLIAGERIDLPLPIGLERSDGPSAGSAGPGALLRAILRQSAEKDDDISCEDGKLTIQGASLRTILSRVYSLPPHRILEPESLDAQSYDALIERSGATPAELFETLRLLLPAALNVKIGSEAKLVPVLILSVPAGNTIKLKKSAATIREESGGPGFLRFTDTPLSHLAAAIQHELRRDVVDETAVSAPYDLNLHWNPGQPESILSAVETQLGLSIVPGERPMTFVTVRKNASPDVK
jgi:uncharacterized protein (TIGR03435 family)